MRGVNNINHIMNIRKYKNGYMIINKINMDSIINAINENNDHRKFIFISDNNRLLNYFGKSKKNINNVYEIIWMHNIDNKQIRGNLFYTYNLKWMFQNIIDNN